METFPFFIKLTHFQTLIIGGGMQANAKAQLLIKAKAQLTVIAPTINSELKSLLQQHKGTWHEKAFCEQDLVDKKWVIIATNDTNFNQQAHVQAKKYGCLVNVVDNLALCDFIFPAIVERGDLVIGISTNGVAPTLSSWLRSKLERDLPQVWRTILKVLKQQQTSIRQTFTDTRFRRRFYRHLIDNIFPQHLNSANPTSETHIKKQIEDQLTTHLNQATHNQTGFNHAKVYLIGAGPGDPELLTIRAQQLLQQADVVLYDRLINSQTLEYIRRDAKKIYVGKKPEKKQQQQHKINQLLVQHAEKNNIVVRLKGGDPFIFGRGGEEIAYLAQKNIPFEVIPGISAVNGIAATLNIPLTLRQISDKLLITTVYADQSQNINWQQLAQSDQTLVIYMGLGSLEIITQQLIKHHMHPNTPIALIEKGTWQQQQTHYTTLQKLLQHPPPPLTPPTLIIIGEIINYRQLTP